MSNDIKVRELVRLVLEENQASTVWSDDFISVRNTEEYKKIERELKSQKESAQPDRGEINCINKIIEHEKRQYKKYLGETDPNAPERAAKREVNSHRKSCYTRLKERFF